jgi:hypothetical protein
MMAVGQKTEWNYLDNNPLSMEYLSEMTAEEAEAAREKYLSSIPMSMVMPTKKGFAPGCRHPEPLTEPVVTIPPIVNKHPKTLGELADELAGLSAEAQRLGFGPLPTLSRDELDAIRWRIFCELAPGLLGAEWERTRRRVEEITNGG